MIDKHNYFKENKNMYKYKNVSELDQSLVGLGLVPAGTEFSSNVKIENPNFVLIGEDKQPIKTENQEVKEDSENGRA